MAKNTITAEIQRGGKTVQRTFAKETWDLLPADKSGFKEVKQAKAPKETKEDK